MRYPPQPLEEKLAWMRQRMAAQAESPKSPERRLSPFQHRRQKRLAAETPAHLHMYRAREVADMLGVSPETVRRWFAGRAVVVGETETTKSRRRKRIFLISRQDLEEWINDHRH